MIYGIVASGSAIKNFDRAKAAGVRFCRSPDLQTSMPATGSGSVEEVVLAAATRGIKLLLLYHSDGVGPDMPIGNLVAQIQRVGPTGTLWNSGQPGAGLGALAPTHIECGNEWSYSYHGNPAASAGGVARTVQRFYNAVGPVLGAGAMKFICEAEDGGDGTSMFLDNLIATVPGIRNLLDGWTIHGYGPVVNETSNGGFDCHQRMVNRLNARGYTTDKIWITENGISSDNGRLLSDNYGYKRDCTYDEAATRLLSIVRTHGTGLQWSSRVYCYLNFKGYDDAAPGATNDREGYFGLYKSDDTAKGALTAAAVQLATEFPLGGSTPPPPPDPVNPPASGFIINGQTMEWAAPAGVTLPAPPATAYKTYERDTDTYTFHTSAVTSYTPPARPPGTTISVGWTYFDGADHWVQEQTITYPASTTSLAGTSVMTFSDQATAVEAAAQSAEITDVVMRMVDVPKSYIVPRYFQVSTGREVLWNASLSKFFYAP